MFFGVSQESTLSVEQPPRQKRRYTVTYESLNWFSSCPGSASGKAD